MAPRISMDLLISLNGEGIVSEESLVAITSACIEILKRLGKQASAVEAFRVIFSTMPGYPGPGPTIQVYVTDPFGAKSSFTSDYRHFGGRAPHPSAEDIADHFCHDFALPRFITGHLERGRARLASVQEAYAQM